MNYQIPETEPRHPIGVVSERTGLSADVLRVWERRYAVVKPARADGGQRMYSDADVERLRLLHVATLAGRSIGRIAHHSTEELARLVDEDGAARSALDARRRDANGALAGECVQAALRAAKNLDAHALGRELQRALSLLGLQDFLTGVAAPLLRTIGEEWHAGRLSPAHEHLATESVRRVAGEVVESLGSRNGAPAVVVATPAGERHETGALLAAAALAAGGWRVIYLGGDLPAADIADAARRTGARAVAVSLVYVNDPEHTVGEMRSLREAVPASATIIAGGGASAPLGDALRDVGVTVADSFDDMRSALGGASAN
jgi:DNA-binding transcriptional MerR regulator/methylmalonyl-CoA mutase cobalamin-binding subunit